MQEVAKQGGNETMKFLRDWIKKTTLNALLSSETGAVYRQPHLDSYCLLHGSDVFGTRYLMSVTAVDI